MILYVLIQLWIGVIEGKAYEASATYQVFSPNVHVISPSCFIECGYSHIGLGIAGMIVYDPPCSCQALSFDEFMTSGLIAYVNGNDIVGKIRNVVAYHPAKYIEVNPTIARETVQMPIYMGESKLELVLTPIGSIVSLTVMFSKDDLNRPVQLTCLALSCTVSTTVVGVVTQVITTNKRIIPDAKQTLKFTTSSTEIKISIKDEEMASYTFPNPTLTVENARHLIIESVSPYLLHKIVFTRM